MDKTTNQEQTPKEISEIEFKKLILDYLKDRIKLEELLLTYLDSTDNVDQNRSTLMAFINDHHYNNDPHELQQFLHFLSYLACHHHRSPGFFDRLIKLIAQFKEEIVHKYTNEQIFNIFNKVGPVVLGLQDNGMITFDDEINSLISESPVLNQFYNPASEEIRSKRLYGENISRICELIREDRVAEFANEVSTTGIALDSIIPESQFETNDILIREKQVTLLQYAAFCGSENVFNNIISQQGSTVKIDETCWLYALIGQNPSIIETVSQAVNLSELPQVHRACALEVIRAHGDIEFLRIQLDERNYKPQEQPRNQRHGMNEKPVRQHYLDDLLSAAIESHNFAYISENIEMLTKEPQYTQLAVREFFTQTCNADLYEISKMLLKIPYVDINLADPYAPLHLAAKYGLYNTFELIMNTQLSTNDPYYNYIKNVDVNRQSLDEAIVLPNNDREDGLTALELAIKSGHYYIFNKLLENNQIKVNGVDAFSKWYGNTPLHICAQYGRNRMLRILLEKKKDELDLNFQNLQIYIYSNNQLNPKGGQLSALQYAVIYNNKEAVKILKDAGADITLKDIFGKTALDLAKTTPDIDPEIQLILE